MAPWLRLRQLQADVPAWAPAPATAVEAFGHVFQTGATAARATSAVLRVLGDYPARSGERGRVLQTRREPASPSPLVPPAAPQTTQRSPSGPGLGRPPGDRK